MADLSHDDAIEALRKLPPDKQREALGRLTPDGRKSVMAKLQSAPVAAAPAAAEQTPGLLKRLATEAFRPIGSHFSTYNAETERMHKAQDFSATEAGRQAYAKHPFLTGAGSFASSMLEGVDDVFATPFAVASELLPGASSLAKAAAPEIAPAVTVIGRATKVGTSTALGAQGGRQILDAATNSNLSQDERIQEALGGAAAVTGVAAEAGKAMQGRITPAALKQALQETLGAGEDFQKGVIKKYARQADATRRINANRDAKNLTNQEGHVAALKKVARANAEAVHNYGQDATEHGAGVDRAVADRDAAIAAQRAEEQRAGDTERVRSETFNEHQQLSAEQQKAYEAAEVKAKAANDNAWNAWRQKIGNAVADMGSVVQAIGSARNSLGTSEVPEFQGILRETKPGPEDLTEVGQLRDQLAQGQGFGKSYDSLTPQQQGTVNDLVDRLGLDGSEEDAGLKELPASRLHGIKAQLEGAVRRTQNGNVRFALGKVLDAVRAKEEEVSQAAGAGGELAKARALHGPYVDTFRNSPNEPATVASRSLAETSPEYVRQQQQQQRLEQVGHYDPSVIPRAARIRSLQQTLDTLPSRTTTAGTQEPEPPPVGLPPKPKMGKLAELPVAEPIVPPKAGPAVPVMQEEIKEQLASNLRKYGRLGVGMARLLFGGLAVGSAHGNVGSMAERLLIGQGAVSVLSKALRSESVLNWLSSDVSPETLKALDKLPPQDAAKVRQVLTGLATEDAKRGQAKAVAPGAAKFLGPQNMALIAAAIAASRPQNAADAKRRVAEARSRAAQ